MQENDIKISFIVPVYNTEKYLEKCLDSLINQTYKNIEIICINDGSTDNSLKILEDFCRRDKRIKLINNNNNGVSITRNIGINNATGDYIIFVDSDDWIEQNTCNIILKKILKFKPDIIYFKYKRLEQNKEKYKVQKNRLYSFDTNITEKALSFNKYYKKILYEINKILCCDKVYKKDFIKKNNIYFPENMVVLEDAIFFLKVCLYNPLFVFVNEYLYNYVVNVENSLSKKDIEIKLEQFEKVYQYLNELTEQYDNKWITLFLYDYFINYLMLFWDKYYFSKYKEKFISYLKNAIIDYDNNNEERIYMNSYKQVKRVFLLAKFHLYWLYSRFIYPIKNLLINSIKRLNCKKYN